MKIRLLILTFLFSILSWGQIITFDFAGIAGSETTATSNTNNVNLTTSTISRGAGLTSSGNADRFNATAWATTSIANAISGNNYMEFTITPNSGYQFDVSSIIVQWQRSGTGNTQIALRNSLDSYATNLDVVKSVVDNTSTQTFTFTFSQLNSSSSVTYRLYSFAESVGGTGGPGDGSGNDIIVNGTVTSSGPAPILAITPATTDMGTSCVGTATTPVTYTITNTGTVDAVGTTVVSSGTHNTNFVVSGLSSTTIPASGGTATFVVTFTPSATGARVATITVASTTSGSNSPSKSLTGTGTATVAQAVTSNAASSVLDVSATLNGNVTTLGVCPATTTKGFVYSITATNSNPNDGGTGVTTTVGVAVGSTGAYNLGITGLTANTNYTYRSYVYNGTTYAYGGNQTFTTKGIPVVSDGSFSGTAGSAITTFNLSTLSTNTPTSYAITSGSLPSGLSLNTTTGAITGTPTISGSFSITFTATNTTGTSATAATVTITINPTQNSDIVAVASSEAATISSTINTTTISTITDGIQVWSFTIRDGGASADADALSTTLTSVTISQGGSNSIATWTDAIQSVALFDGSTFVANGVVSTNTIAFSSISVVAPDNGIKTLTMRLSLKCPLGATALDGNDFDFSITPTNTTFLATGSGKNTSFPIPSTPDNTSNYITVVASKLMFSSQPATTGVNTTMTNVVITATDACGNKDKDFVGTVSLTSTGTMSGAPISITAVAGVATYTGIIHNIIGTGLTLGASATGVTAATSNNFDITVVTVLQKGDLAIIAVNTSLGGNDEIAFVSYQDITPGTAIFMTDNGYQSGYANKWGGTEGVISITRTGSTLTKGTIIVFKANTANVSSGTDFDIYTCGVVDTNWNKVASNYAGAGGFNLNSDDDVWIMQGGTWTNDTGGNSTYNGNVLYGWTESGWNATHSNGTCTNASGSDPCTKRSTIYPGLECYNTVAPVGVGKVKFNDPATPDFSATTNGRLDWIALINNTANWTTFTDDTSYNAGGYDYAGNTTCPALTIFGETYVNGKWTGRIDTNWFNCGNWDTLVVPDETVDVIVADNTFNNQAIVDATAPQSDYYGDIAKAKNLTITGEKVEVTTETTNRLEVYGNLLIDSPAGALDMNGGGITDGQLFLYGNWTNNVGNSAFSEGNGTVVFTGSTPQIISNVTPEGTESFGNVILNNNFNTSVSNDIIANGNLTINATKTLTVASNDYVKVQNNVTNNGIFEVLNNGSLVQINNAGVNTGNIRYNRTANVRKQDYVYWSSPVASFASNAVSPGTSLGYQYKWLPTTGGINRFGNWALANETMILGKGYCLRAPDSYSLSAFTNYNATFVGVPNNGNISIPISRGDYDGANYSTGVSTTPGTKDDDNWNLVGNPYPSAIDAKKFLTLNTNIAGFVNIWTHGTLPSNAIIDPFYNDYAYNYTATDYITYNSTGTSTPGGFNGFIGAGQGFFVSMLHGPGAGVTTENLIFNNDLRRDIPTGNPYNNGQFYRGTNTNESTNTNELESHRIWLDIVNPSGTSARSLLGYIENATNEKDRLFDAFSNEKLSFNIFSLINNEQMLIQGRKLPFDVNDKVKIGVSIPQDGLYKIAIGSVDGLFLDAAQNIYLEDKLLNITYSLKEAPYSFMGNKGIITDRFVLKFAKELLTNETFDNNSLTVISNQEISVLSTKEKINDIIVFDVLGRKLFEAKNIDTNNFTLPISKHNATLFIEIKLKDGTKVNRKTIY